MKAYTDIEQSKKLADILPTESADMFWADGERPAVWNNKDILLDEMDIPAWSLAALIDVLPLGVDIQDITDGHKKYYYVEIYTKEIYMKLRRMGRVEICLSTVHYENLVDACVEMILTLKKINLL